MTIQNPVPASFLPKKSSIFEIVIPPQRNLAPKRIVKIKTGVQQEVDLQIIGSEVLFSKL